MDKYEYETIFIMKSNVNEKSRKEVVSKVENYIKEKGKLINTEDLGLKKLAYEIKKNKEGHYYLINFEMDKNDILGLERIYRIQDEILKFITVRRDD